MELSYCFLLLFSFFLLLFSSFFIHPEYDSIKGKEGVGWGGGVELCKSSGVVELYKPRKSIISAPLVVTAWFLCLYQMHLGLFVSDATGFVCTRCKRLWLHQMQLGLFASDATGFVCTRCTWVGLYQMHLVLFVPDATRFVCTRCGGFVCTRCSCH